MPDDAVDIFDSSEFRSAGVLLASAFFSTALNNFDGDWTAVLRGDSEPPSVNFTIFCCFDVELVGTATARFDDARVVGVLFNLAAFVVAANAGLVSETTVLAFVAIARSNKLLARSEDGVGASKRLNLLRELIISSVAARFRAGKNDVIDGEDIFLLFLINSLGDYYSLSTL